MGTHPINLAVRFFLELAALTAVGVWGWKQSDSWPRFVWAIGLPLLLAAAWGTFAVPDDPSRSGGAPVPTNGIVRLAIELAFFGLAIWALHNIGYARLAWTMAGLVAVHYILSYDRIVWLLAQ